MVVACLVTPLARSEIRLDWIPNPIGREPLICHDLSVDGTTIVGDAGTPTEAFKWSEAGGFKFLGRFIPGSFSSARAVSADGSVVAGRGDRPPFTEDAFRWTESTGLVGLTSLGSPDSYTWAADISNDGNVIVGPAASNIYRGFVWSSTGGKQYLTSPFESGNESYSATACGGTGWPVAGSAQDGLVFWHSMNDVEYLVSPGSTIFPRRLSENGQFIVSRLQGRPMTWSPGTEFKFWGTLRGYGTGVTNDGKMICGVLKPDDYGQGTACLGFEGQELVELDRYLARQGHPYTPSNHLEEAIAMTPDGSRIVGFGRGPQGQTQLWLATFDRTMLPIDPVSVTPRSGALFQGGLSNILYRDGSELIILPDDETLIARIDVVGIAPSTTGEELRFMFEGHVGRVGVAQVIQIRKLGGTFITIDARIASTNREFIDIPMTTDINQFIGAGRSVWARLQWQPVNDEDPAQDSWPHFVDMARWTIKL